MSREIDILEVALNNKVDVLSALSMLKPGDKVSIKEPSHYDQFLTGMDDPDRLTPEVAQIMYKQAAQIKSMYDNNIQYLQPDPDAAYLHKTIGFGGAGYFDAIGSMSKSPVTHSPFAEPGRVRSTKQDAYNKDYYYEPDPNDLGTYIKKKKEPGYMNSGTFIYDSDPEISGGTALVKLDDGANTAGYEQFKSLFGNPDDFTRNLFLESLKTVASAFPRLGASTASYMEGMSGYVNAKRDIFKPESKGKFDVYLNHIKAAIGEDAMMQKKLNEVLATGTETDKLKFFNYIEQQQPIAVRNNLKSMRMTDSWKARDERFNQMYNVFNAHTSDTPIAYSQGAMHSIGSFLYTSATVLADLGVQMVAARLTGGMSAFAAFGGVGMLQAVGGFARELKEAGFDDDTIAYATTIASPIIMGTEAIAGSAWAFKKMPEDMIEEIAKDMAEKYVKEASGRVISKSPIEAMKMGMEGAKRMWHNPSFRKIVDNPFYAPILKAGPVEAVQENLEDVGYNTIKLAVERWTRPEYYGEQITTGIKDWGGDDGVFNGKQMLETALVSAFASVFGGYIGSGLRGEFKKPYRDQMRDLAQSEFLAEQIAEGNSDLLFDMAKREAKKDVGAFGSKQDLLVNLGVNDVVVPAESDKWDLSGMGIGTKQQDGSTVITNMADLNAYQFLQRLQSISDAAAAGGLNENSLNVKMLHELIGVNGTLMSVNAVKAANKVAEAKKALDDYKATLDEDETKHTQEQKDKLKEHEEALAAANALMDYYVKPEDGLKYSKAVNDQMKELMATYQLADEKAKEYLGDKYDPNDNKTYKKVKEFWIKEIAASYSYRNMNELQGKLKMWMEHSNQKREEERQEYEARRTAEFKPTPESDDLFSSLEKATKELEAISSMEPRQALAAMNSFDTSELSSKLESLKDTIPPSVLNDRIAKFQQMYEAARGRLTGVSTEIDSVVNAFKLYSQSEDPFVKALADADEGVIMQAGEDIRSGMDAFEAISHNATLKGLLDEYIKSHTPEEVEAFKNSFAAYALAYSSSEITDANEIITGNHNINAKYVDDAARDAAYQRKIDEIKPIEQMSEGIEVLLEEATKMAAKAKELAKNPNKRSKEFGDQTAEQIEGTLQAYSDLIDGLKTAMKISDRMVKSSRLSSHATASEIGLLKNFADPKKQEEYKAQVDQFEKDHDTFYQASGLAALKGINRSHHNRMLIVGNQVDMIRLLHDLEIMKDGKNIISDALYKELEGFKITQEMFDKNGEFDEKERAAITKAERALTQIAIELNRNREFLEKRENFDKMMAPVEQMLRAMNAPESAETKSGNTTSTMTPYTGHYTKPGEQESSTDTGVMRFMAASLSFTEALNNMKLSDHQRVVVEEKVRTYTNFLLYAMSPIDIVEVDNTRNYLYENKVLMAPTAEQRQASNSAIAMLSGSEVIGMMQAFEHKVLDSIYPGRKREALSSITADNQGTVDALESRFIRNGILIPGVYGAGKTEIVFREALIVLSQMKKKLGTIQFYVPSESLKTSYMSMFNSIVPDAKSYLMHHNIDAMKPVTTPTVIVVDEGSLLSKARIAKLASLETESKGNLKIVVLADVNQMRPTEASESFGAFPEIITSMHKTIQLTEHFSSASDMINKHADFWLRKVTEQRNVGTEDGMGTLTDLMLAYHEVHNGNKVGSEYLSSTEEVYNAFISSKNTSKALVFYSKQEYLDMLQKHPELKAEEDAKRVFVLKPEDGMVIQGLRAEEVYLVTDYKTIRGVSPSRVATAIYTFVGRASRYYAMNIGSQAPLFTTKDKTKVPRIAAEASDTEIRESKKEKLRESVMASIKRNLGSLFKGKKADDFASGQTREGSKAPEAPPVVPGKTPPTPPDQQGDTDFQEKLRKATKTGKVTLLDGRVIEYTAVPIDINDPKSKYRYTFNIGDGKILTFDGYKGLQNKTITTRIQKAVDNYQAQHDGDDNLDKLLDGEDDGLGQKPEILPAIEVPGISQAKEYEKTGGLYVNTAGIILPKGSSLSEELREEYRALHTAIIRIHEDRKIGRMVYKLHEDAYVTAEGGYMNAKNVVSVQLVLTPDERKALLTRLGLLAKSLSSEHSDWADSAYTRALIKLTNGGIDLDSVLNVGLLTLPTLGMPKRGKSSKKFDKLDDVTLEEGRKIIRDSFEKERAAVSSDKALTSMVIAARDAQLELFALRYYLKHSETKELPAKLGSTAYADGRPIAAVEYDINNEPQLFSDLLDGRMFSGENPSYSAKGNLVLRVSTDPDDAVGVPVAVRADKLGKRTNLKEKFAEDKETLRRMPNTKDPLGTSTQVHAMYSASMRMWRKMFLYQVLMNNRAYIQEHRKDLEKYITFHEENGKYVLNPNGKTLAERNENIEHLLNSIDKLTDLYDAVLFTKVDDPSSPYKFKIELDPNGAPLWTHAKRINSNGYYFKPEDGSWIDALPKNDGAEEKTAGEHGKKASSKKKDQVFESSEVDADSPMVDNANSRQLLADMLGGRFSKLSSEFVDGFITEEHMKATGMMKNGRIYMSSFFGKTKMSTPFHETLHVVWNYLLDPKEKERYEKLAQEKAKKATGKLLVGRDLEEWIASDFARASVNKKKLSRWDRFVLWLKDLVNFVHNNRKGLDGLYDDIYYGRYKSAASKMKPGNTGVTMFEEAYDEQEEASITESAKEEDELTEETLDRIDRFNNLMDAFPSDRAAMDKYVRGARLKLINLSPLSGESEFILDPNKAIARIRQDSKELAEEYGAMEVLVIKGGEQTLTPIKDVPLTDYEYIYMDDPDATPEENKSLAKSYMRYVHVHSNMDTILEHIMPDFSARTGRLSRGKVAEESFSWSSMNPETDGFNSMMKLHLSTIPVVSYKKGVLSYSIRDVRFVDYKMLNKLLKGIGVAAMERYTASGGRLDNRLASRMDFFLAELDRTILEDFNTAVNSDGSFQNAYVEALISFRTRFTASDITNKGRNTLGKHNRSNSKRKDFVEKLPTTHIESTNQTPVNSLLNIAQGVAVKLVRNEEVSKEERMRMEAINNFLTQFVNVTMSYQVNNNSRIGIKGSIEQGFDFTLTEFHTNLYDHVKSVMIDNINSKFSNGLFVSPTLKKKFNERVHVDDNGNITMGFGRTHEQRSQVLISVRDSGKAKDGSARDYYFDSLDDDGVTKKQGVKRTIDLLRKLNAVIGLGIGTQAFPERVVMNMLEATSWDDLNKDSLEQPFMKEAMKAYDTPQKYLAAFVANSIYAIQAQIDTHEVELTYQSSSGSTIQYKGNGTISKIAPELDKVMDQDKPARESMGTLTYYTYDGDGNRVANHRQVRMNKDGGIPTSETRFTDALTQLYLPKLPWMKNFMSNTGTLSALNSRNSNTNETLTKMGYSIPVPSQFYNVLNLIASESSAEMGIVTGVRLFRADGKPQQVLQQSNRFTALMKGGWNTVNGIKSKADVRLIPELAMKMYEERGKSGVKKPATQSQEDATQEYYQSVIVKANKLASDPEFVKEVSKVYLGNETLMRMGSLGAYLHHIAAIQLGIRRNHEDKFANRDGYILGSDKDIESFKKENRLQYPDELIYESVLVNNDGAEIAPYFSQGKDHFLLLDHLTDMFGISREYGSFSHGTNNPTALDLTVGAMAAFANKLRTTTNRDQVVITPVMTISDTGRTYYMHTMARGDKPLLDFNHGVITMNSTNMLTQVYSQVAKIERRIDIAYNHYIDLLTRLNALYGSRGLVIQMPATGEKRKAATILDKQAFIRMNESIIKTALDRLDDSTRKEVMDFVRGSELDKITEVQVTSDGFRIGTIASGIIPNWTEDDSHYSQANRDKIRAAMKSKQDAYKVLKEIFMKDYKHWVLEMQQLGMDDKVNPLMKYGQMKQAWKDGDVHSAMFAYFMATHVTNNALDDIMPSSMTFKDFNDKTKRIGTYGTPTIKLTTENSVTIDHSPWGFDEEKGIEIEPKPIVRRTGSMGKVHKAINISDPLRSARLGTETKEGVMAADGLSWMNALMARMYQVSAGGKDYSVSGDGKMIKTLYTHHDPYKGTTTIVKHAAHMITGFDFMGNKAYYNMQMDMLREQDRILDKAALVGTPFEGFSWADTFVNMMDNGMTFDEAMDALHDTMVDSQRHGDSIYDALSNSVIYGVNTLQTEKGNYAEYNEYDPESDERMPQGGLALMDMYMDDYHIILDSTQEADDSKKQSPPNQQEPFFGINGELQGGLAEKYGPNPSIAINNIKAKMYDAGMKKFMDEVSKIQIDDLSGINFNQVDWTIEDLYGTYGEDIHYALAQYEEHVRMTTRRSLDRSKVPGVFVQMLSKNGITSQVPQMRSRIINSVRKEINRIAIKQAWTGMRVVQTTGAFTKVYTKKGDSLPYTRQEAIMEVYGYIPSVSTMFSPEVEAKIAEQFDVSDLQDMRIEDGKTVPGQIIMSFAHAAKFGLEKGQSIKDLFGITDSEGKYHNIRHMSKKGIFYLLKGSEGKITSVLANKAMGNLKKAEKDINIESLAQEIFELKEAAHKAMFVYDNRVPSNRMGSGAIHEIVGFSDTGNIAYIPLGMTLMNDADFDIDQLTVYLKSINRDGKLSDEEVEEMNNEILDIIFQAYMSKENQENLFVESSIKPLKAVGEEQDSTPINANTPYAHVRTYNDNKAGADGIGILANTLSAVAWLQVMSPEVLSHQHNPIIDRIMKNRNKKGIGSMVFRLGDWLQASLDNNKYNIFGRYGITEEIIPVLGIMAAEGPDTEMTEEEYFRYIKNFFMDPVVRKAILHAQKGSSVMFSRKEHSLYLSVVEQINAINKRVKNNSYAAKMDMDQEAEEKKMLMLELKLAQTLDRLLPDIIESAHRPYLQEHAIEDMTSWLSNNSLNDDNKPDYIEKTLSGIRRMHYEKMYTKMFNKDEDSASTKNDPDNVLYREFLSQRGIMYSFQNRERDEQALPKLEKLRDLIVTAEAVRGFSNVVSLRNGIPHNDWEFYNRTQALERTFGMSLKQYVDTTDISVFDLNEEQLDEYTEMILLRDNEALEIPIDEQWKYEALRDKIKAVREAINTPAVVKQMPMMHRYIEQMLKDSNMNGALFMMDSKSFDDSKLAMQDRMGIGNWRFAKDQAGFKDMILEYGVDQWFNSLPEDEAIVHLAFPLQSGNGYAYDHSANNAYGLMDVRNVYVRQELSLRLPVFISAFDEAFDSAAEMEAYFAAMVPPGHRNIYEGVSKAFFDANGAYIGNQFISMIREVGSTERKYVGLMHNTSNMTEEERTVLGDEFRKLPKGIRRLFFYNEVINNQLSYRKGSISDVMGLEPYRMGLSDIMDANARAIRSKQHPLLNDPALIDRWMDIMALKNGNTRYVKEANINNGEQPFYINSFIRAENRRRARKVNLKRNAETADYDRITLITNRAGFSSETNTVALNIEVLSISEGNNQELKLSGSTTVVLNEPHSYERGTYFTDTGVMVEMTYTTINSYTITRLNEAEQQKKIEEQEEKVKAKHNRIIPISTKQEDSSYGPTQHKTQYQEFSMYATRPFTVPAGTVEGFDKDMQFDRLVDAIVYFRIALAKMLFRGDRLLLSGLKIDEKIEDPVMRYNKANKDLDELLRRHKNKDGVAFLISELNLNMSDIAKRLVKSSIFGNGPRMPLDSMTETYLTTKHRFNESLRRYFKIEKQMDFSDMIYLGSYGTDEVFKSPVRIKRIATSDIGNDAMPHKDLGKVVSEEESILSTMPFYGNMDEITEEDEARENNNDCL